MLPIHQTYSPFGREFTLSVAEDIKDTGMVEYWQKWWIFQCQMTQTLKYPRWKEITVLADIASPFSVSHQIWIFQTFQTDSVGLCHLRHSRGSIPCKFVLKPWFFFPKRCKPISPLLGMALAFWCHFLCHSHQGWFHLLHWCDAPGGTPRSGSAGEINTLEMEWRRTNSTEVLQSTFNTFLTPI